MRGPAKDLKRQRRIDPARSFLQEANVLIFRLANATQRGPKTYPDSILGLFSRVDQPGVVQRHFRRRDRELSITIQPLQPVRWKKLLRIPVANFTRRIER